MRFRLLVGLLAAAPLAMVLGFAPARGATPVAGDIRDIHGPIARPSEHPRWWAVGAGAAVAVTAAGVALWPRRRRRRLPPDVRALHALARQRALLAGHPRDFAIAVSETVRAYLEEAFGVHAPRRTTEELLADLIRQKGPLTAYQFELTEFLRQCDLAKFAGAALSQARMVAMLDSAEALVKATAAPVAAPSPVAPLAGVA
ncbi:MAG TPA: hypothetical protein VHO67_13775 [Polyangia bacterium]|nr:hypothetical protein [Polyangia bacterium]